jgi:imidazole glycerol phosphate synthase glutamine amidotransferase subunit
VSAPEVLVLPTGTANLASVLAAFGKLGADARPADDPRAIETAERVVLPGVGTFGATMAGLRAANLDRAIAARVQEGRHTFAMCVGLQVLFEASDESPDAVGLGVVRGRVGRFPDEASVPQFGWNRIEPEPGCRYLEPDYAYFANSFRVQAAPGCRTASALHGDRFVAALEREHVVACQFHPELSGRFGHNLLKRWLEG